MNTQSYSKLGDEMKILNAKKEYRKVLDLFKQFNEENIDQCSNWTVIQVLKACSETKDVECGLKLHELISSRLKHDAYVLPSLIHFYMQCCDVHQAEKLFALSAKKTLQMYGAMMKGFISNQLPQKAINIFKEMKDTDKVSVNLLFNACAQLGTENELTLVKTVSAKMPTNFYSDPYVLTSLVDAFMKCGDVKSAELLFESSRKELLPMTGAMMKGYILNNMPQKAIDIFHRITRPREIDYNLFFNACAQLGTNKELLLVRKVYSTMPQTFSSNNYLLTSLIDALMKCGDFTTAENLFDRSTNKTLPMYGSLMRGWIQNDFPDKVIDEFQLIDRNTLYKTLETIKFTNQRSTKENNDFETNITIHLCLIKALAQIGLSTIARTFIERIPNVILNEHMIQNALIDMWGRVECVAEAKRVFESILEPNHISYTAMINSYGLNGMGVDAVELYRRMPKEFINDLTYTCVLNSCSHSGLVDTARSIFNEIQTENEIIYTAMIDCLSRVAAFEEAQGLIKRFEQNHSPSISMYMAVLSGARNQKNITLSEAVIDRMHRLFPDSKDSLTAASILLANTFASSGDIEKAGNIRMQLQQPNVKKEIGMSWTEVDGKMLRFRAHDRSHPQVNELYATVDRISKELLQHGHEYDPSWIMRQIDSDETVESVLCGHSERLAIAAHFLGDRKPKRIQVTKNLRVCGDCHRVTKLIAAIFDCEIIVRDANRIHHFHTNGQCSCQDHF